MTYKDLYNQMLDECSETCPTCQSYGAARILEEMDPIAYRCGFSDYLDSLSDQDIQCDSCTNTIDSHHIVNDCGMDDEVECQVCAGTHFECEGCNELFEVDEMYKGSGMCEACAEETA